jgi:hypothetical protein
VRHPLHRGLAATVKFLVGLLLLPLALTALALRPFARKILIWGPTPIINLKYWSRAFSRAGVASETLVTHHFSIFDRSDFDVFYDELVPWPLKSWPLLVLLVAPYPALFRILMRAEVLHTSFLGGPLGTTPFAGLEPYLYKLAGVRTVVSCYGGDAYQYSLVRELSLKHGLLSNYPQAGREDHAVHRRVDRWNRHADAILLGTLTDGAARWDCLPVSQLTIDTETWTARSICSGADGVTSPVRIIHTPNHRVFKGTEFIIDAVDRLKARGLLVELDLLEGVKNTEVRARMQLADILVEQIIVAGYALSAIEGMASGLTVLSNLTDERFLQVFRRYSYLDECPIVAASPETIGEVLEKLIRSPRLRAMLGRAGRAYVEKYHSDEMARFLFGTIHDKVLGRREVDLINLFHPLKSEWMRSRPRIEHPLERNRIPASWAEPAAKSA